MLRLSDFELRDTKIDEEELKQYSDEDKFNSISVELMKDVGQITAILASSYRMDEEYNARLWNRNEAIIGGLMIRVAKLQMALLDQFCQNRSEIVEIIFRCFAETLINIEYLIKVDDDKVYKEFLEYGLRNDKRMLKIIDLEIQERGHEIPIEKRIRKSIANIFKISTLRPEDVDDTKRTSWGEDIYRRAKKIGRGHQYIALFGMASSAVHGNWSDLLRYHIEQKGEVFSPAPEWTYSRPQLLLSAAQVCAEVNLEFINHFIPNSSEKDKLIEISSKSIEKLGIVNYHHEHFLIARMKP